MQNRRFARRSRPVARGVRPSRMWAGVSGEWLMNAVTATTAVPLVQLQAPASLASLTSDPPEDLTVLRLVGSFNVQLSTTSAWALALTVADVTWTPGSNILVDSDKRLLWMRVYSAAAAAVYAWREPGYLAVNNVVACSAEGHVNIDISPKVKIEAGKALYLVAYESTGAAEFTTTSSCMRLLVQRSGR